jgi:orotidine-5'-phosphate decarboxylase
MQGARDGAGKAGVAPPKVLAVTVLTSLRDEDVAQMGSSRGASELAQHLAHFSCEAGVDGLVCSPREVGALRGSLKRRLYLCTPGIRPAGAEAGDQARAETPSFAIRAGSDLLVAGRPIYGAPDPVAAARALHAEVSAA